MQLIVVLIIAIVASASAFAPRSFARAPVKAMVRNEINCKSFTQNQSPLCELESKSLFMNGNPPLCIFVYNIITADDCFFVDIGHEAGRLQIPY